MTLIHIIYWKKKKSGYCRKGKPLEDHASMSPHRRSVPYARPQRYAIGGLNCSPAGPVDIISLAERDGRDSSLG